MAEEGRRGWKRIIKEVTGEEGERGVVNTGARREGMWGVREKSEGQEGLRGRWQVGKR